MRNVGKYSLAALTPELMAKNRDDRLAGLDCRDAKGKPAPKPRSPNTVRLFWARSHSLPDIGLRKSLPFTSAVELRLGKKRAG